MGDCKGHETLFYCVKLNVINRCQMYLKCLVLLPIKMYFETKLDHDFKYTWPQKGPQV